MTDRLNPEALEAAACELEIPCASCEIGNDPNPCRFCESTAERIIRAYLAALPAPRTITTVEELEALPVGTVLRLARKELAEIGKSFGSKTLRATEWTEYLSDWGAEETEYLLPATVLHVPTEGGGE